MGPLRLGVRSLSPLAPSSLSIVAYTGPLHSTIGDWFPERNVFQLLIALTSGPRFLLVLVSFISHRHLRPQSTLPAVLALIAVVRTISCGGWVFVTSSDHGDVHDVFMVLCAPAPLSPLAHSLQQQL